ncbi:MAG: metallophosphoesterase [Candidatus Coproplasma sp.]
MVYVCSDIHGEYEKFLRLLEKIRFKDSDEMIVCGDVIDKGDGSVRLLKLISGCDNFTFIMGNHEYDFLKYYRSLMMNESSDYGKVLKKLQSYFPVDGHLLDWDIMDWLERQPFSLERENFICVHSGIPVLPDNTLMSVEKATAEQLVYDRRFKQPSVLPETEKCIFFGHTPSNYLTEKHKIITYPKVTNPVKISDFTKIHLDIGTWLGGGVGCFCVDTLEEYYVD